MSGYVLMVTPNEFPEGDAGAVRDLSFAKIYMELGYKVYMICKNQKQKNGEFQGVEFVSIFKPAKNAVDKAIRHYGYSHTLKQAINTIEIKYGVPSIIHLYDAPLNGIEYLKKYAKKNGAVLIHDSVEWYSECEFEKGKWDKAYILKDKLNTKYIDSSFRVIAISSYLKEHFESRGIKSIRIPVIMDMEKGIDTITREGKKINLVYAGSPANKDLLKNMLQAFIALPENIVNKLHFNIVGVTKVQVLSRGMCAENQLDKYKEHITFYGRVPRSEVLNVLKKSDFSVLVRPANERYAKAGYPTKSVEAMMNSVAMLCNVTSDLGLYLKDGENAMLIQDESVASLKEGYERIAKLSEREIIQIRNNARKTAENSFDYRLYSQAVKELLT